MADEADSLVFEVCPDDLRRVRAKREPAVCPAAGEVLCEVERFAFSANNLTYALLGERLGYWRVFPTRDGWGRIPAWGYLRVRESRSPDIRPGRRLFGLCPMATQVLLRPGRVTEAGFVDTAPHRMVLSSAYNSYSWLDTDPAYRPTLADELLLLRPLFWLSFMLADLLAEERLLEHARTVLITSASSKAAIGTAHILSDSGARVVGLTSAAHAEVLIRRGSYQQVVPYEKVDALERQPTVLLDIAGGEALREEISARLAESLLRTVIAGATHLDPSAATDAGGAGAESFLFVPERMRTRAHAVGWPELSRRYSSALLSFAADAREWLQIAPLRGADAIERAYFQTLENRATPERAFVMRLTEGEALVWSARRSDAA
jgi:NADPH:quinone reductase-like Zn-dependent oxidoreductase